MYVGHSPDGARVDHLPANIDAKSRATLAYEACSGSDGTVNS
ncbi:hypothetical protein [Burkholderia sp. Bp8998]|nr:hypothetical protein [Burkholderia sp. Bp8998]